jgi:sulfur-oxidizing protein SoxY
MKRRDFLVAGVLGLPSAPLLADADEMSAALAGLVKSSVVRVGKVALDLPPLVENGNLVSLTVSVDSPMTASEHVRAIHIFAEKNPQPYVAVFRLGPRSGRAQVSTRIRLANSQTVLAIGEMSDGSLWSGSAEVIVTLAACTEVL